MADRLPPQSGTVRIEVRPRDYEGAIPQNSFKCPIANALRRTFPDLDHVSVASDYIGLDGVLWRHDGQTLIGLFDSDHARRDNAPPVSPVTLHRRKDGR